MLLLLSLAYTLALASATSPETATVELLYLGDADASPSRTVPQEVPIVDRQPGALLHKFAGEQPDQWLVQVSLAAAAEPLLARRGLSGAADVACVVSTGEHSVTLSGQYPLIGIDLYEPPRAGEESSAGGIACYRA